MSKWDWFPYVAGGKQIAQTPIWAQILVLSALAAFWIVLGVVAHQTWLIAVGAMIGVGLVIKLGQQGASRR